MTTRGNFYRVQLVYPDGHREQKQIWGNGSTNAHWIASQLHPDAQVSVLSVIAEYDAE